MKNDINSINMYIITTKAIIEMISAKVLLNVERLLFKILLPQELTIYYNL